MLSLLRRSVVQARFVLTGCLLLLGALQVVLAGQASAIEATQSFGRMAEFVPAFLQRGLGSKAMLFATFKGTIAFGYFHPVIVVLLAGLAAYFSTEPAHDVETGRVDVILARPVRRSRLITRSALAAAASVVLATIVMGVGTSLGYVWFALPTFDALPVPIAVRLLVHLAALGWCFGALGLALGASSRRWSTAFTAAVLTIIVMYLVDFLAIGWPPMRSIAWISPFHYYPALSIVAGDAPAWRNIAILLAAAAAQTVLAYWQFGRRDL
jgi:ABC-2 type transport system permease protein